MQQRQNGRAVVIGGSMGGLLAARALADHFAHVTVIERDAAPRSPEARKGVPQGRHIHGMLIRGERVLTRFFPDLVTELLALGARRVYSAGVAMHQLGTWKATLESDYSTVVASRPLWDLLIHQRVSRLPNVTVLSDTDALSLEWRPAKDGVAGVWTQSRDASQQRALLPADWVVDASGKGSRLPQWLAEAGYPAAPEESLTIGLAYASRFYRRPQLPRPWEVLYAMPKPPQRRLGAVFPVEGDRWLVSLAGWHDEPAPRTDAEFREFARSLAVPEVHAAICSTEPLSEISVFKFPTNRRRRYERAGRWPEGLLAVGDAMCSFNPIYGQGMTVCALQAEELDRLLGGAGRLPPARGVQARLARLCDIPWTAATLEDRRWSESGKRPLWLKLLHAYTARVCELSAQDPELVRIFGEVGHLLRPPTALMSPSVLWKVLTGKAQPRQALEPTAPAEVAR